MTVMCDLKMQTRKRRYVTLGFTLIELLVVVVIIGLLAAYVGPRYFAQLGKSERATAKAQIEGLGKALDAYRLDTGRYPTWLLNRMMSLNGPDLIS
jgi:general secretion pathway protein G